MSKFVRVLRLPPEKHRRSLPRQVGANLMAAIGAVQQLCSPAASSLAGQVPSQCPLLTANSVPPHVISRSPTMLDLGNLMSAGITALLLRVGMSASRITSSSRSARWLTGLRW